MTSRQAVSAGVLCYRTGPEVLLVHPGGPFWRNKDVGTWQIPKGLIGSDEDAEGAARREVAEELGLTIMTPLKPLGDVRQAGGKRVIAFAAEQEFDVQMLQSNSFEVEWPPRSGRLAQFPEVDEARWFVIDEARRMMLPSQQPFLDRLLEILAQLD